MATRTEARHTQLRNTLTDIAERWIAEDGLVRIKARPLAQEAGCAVGAIYTVFPDLTALVMAVNGRTFRRLGTAVSDAVRAEPGDAVEQMVVMGRAYLAFAVDNTQAWRSLFDLEMSTDHEVPAWYLDELGALFALIAAPLHSLNPDAPRGQIDLMTRTLFSSVHGIVLLGLEHRISAVPRADMEQMIAQVIRALAHSKKF